MVRHQRQSVRKRTRIKARVSRAGGGDTIAGYTRDISPHGLFVQTRKPFPPGTPIRVELLYGEERVDLKGVVVRSLSVPAHLQGIQTPGMGIRVAASGALTRAAGSARDARITLGSDVVVFFGSERHHLKLHDLSTSGIALVATTKLPEMGFVRIHFKMPPTREVIELEGIPVGIRPVGDHAVIGINFIDPPVEIVTRIQALIDARGGGEVAFQDV